jgi:hypothetical protein
MAITLLAISFGAEKARPLRRSFKRIGHPSIFQPGVRSAYLDTGRGGGVSANVAILSLRVCYRNGPHGWNRPWPRYRLTRVVNVMTPLPLFLRKNVILWELFREMMQECDSAAVRPVTDRFRRGADGSID